MNKKMWIVGRKEVFTSIHHIEADTAKEAKEKLEDGEENEISCEFAYTLGTDVWTVEEK